MSIGTTSVSKHIGQPVRPATAAPTLLLRWEAGSFSVRYAVDGLNDALAAATGGLSI